MIVKRESRQKGLTVQKKDGEEMRDNWLKFMSHSWELIPGLIYDKPKKLPLNERSNHSNSEYFQMAQKFSEVITKSIFNDNQFIYSPIKTSREIASFPTTGGLLQIISVQFVFMYENVLL